MSGEPSVEWCVFANVFFVRWWQIPSWHSIEQVEPELAAHARTIGGPAIVLSHHVELRRPSEDEMTAWDELAPRIGPHVLHAHVVLDAGGVLGSVVRSSINSMLILRGAASRVSVYGSIQDGREGIAARHGKAAQALERAWDLANATSAFSRAS